MEKFIDRAEELLRGYAIHLETSKSHSAYLDYEYMRCDLCKGKWEEDEEEKHIQPCIFIDFALARCK